MHWRIKKVGIQETWVRISSSFKVANFTIICKSSLTRLLFNINNNASAAECTRRQRTFARVYAILEAIASLWPLKESGKGVRCHTKNERLD